MAIDSSRPSWWSRVFRRKRSTPRRADKRVSAMPPRLDLQLSSTPIASRLDVNFSASEAASTVSLTPAVAAQVPIPKTSADRPRTIALSPSMPTVTAFESFLPANFGPHADARALTTASSAPPSAFVPTPATAAVAAVSSPPSPPSDGFTRQLHSTTTRASGSLTARTQPMAAGYRVTTYVPAASESADSEVSEPSGSSKHGSSGESGVLYSFAGREPETPSDPVCVSEEESAYHSTHATTPRAGMAAYQAEGGAHPEDYFEPAQSEHNLEPAQSEHNLEPAQSEHILEPAQSEHILEPAQSEHILEPAQSEHYLESEHSQHYLEPAQSQHYHYHSEVAQPEHYHAHSVQREPETEFVQAGGAGGLPPSPPRLPRRASRLVNEMVSPALPPVEDEMSAHNVPPNVGDNEYDYSESREGDNEYDYSESPELDEFPAQLPSNGYHAYTTTSLQPHPTAAVSEYSDGTFGRNGRKQRAVSPW